ncbi:MAG: MFS transporter [Deltaproteobacteria bacterium]|nr:MFS transporter [Deltaproteobacteria bacterium]MBW1979154.1 MFS transporter [Deltaproteobacteria bacterium]MBW2301902.1 MFS transporter [Deltaproteobacteria bacterium]
MIRRAFPVLGLAIFSSMLGVGIVAPLLPLYAENMGASGTWIGIIFAGFSISRAVVMPIAGKLSDRSGRKLFLGTGLLIYSLISMGYIWASTVSGLTLVRLVQGVAAGMVIPIAQAYVGDISPEAEEGTWMGYFNAAFFTGFGFGPLMGGTLTDHFGMNVAFSTMGALNLLGFFLVTFLLPEVKAKRTKSGLQPSYREIGRSNTVKGLLGFRLAFSVGRGAFASFLPIFAGVYIGLSPTRIGILIAANILLMSLLQPCGGAVADRISRRLLVVLGSIANLAFLALIPSGVNFWQLLAICLLGSIGGAISIPAASALIVEEGRKFGMGSTMAVFGMVFSIGMAIGPLLGGVIADVFNIRSVFYFGSGMGVLGTSFFIWCTK